MDLLEQHRKTIRARIVASIVVYLVFLASAIRLGLSGQTFRDDMMLLWIIPLILTIVILPRSTQPDRWPTPQSAEDADRIEFVRDEMRATYQRTIVMRVVYISLAFLTIFMLGKLGV